jgi:general secretion pathway protein D
MRKFILAACCALSAMGISIGAQTISEKKAGIGGGSSELSPEMQKFLVEINKELKERQEDLLRYQDAVLDLYHKNAPPDQYRQILVLINEVKENIRILQESWREMATKPGMQDEGYALWHQPETTLEQLVIDYGSMEYVYLIPPEIGKIEVSVSSNIPIPQSSWGEMLEQILLQNGVGIKTLNPYLRQLYIVQQDLSSLRLITANPRDLEVYPSNTRVSFVLTPEPMDVKRIWYFLEKFVNHNSTVLQRIGRAILLVGEVEAVKELLKIYDFVTANKRELEYRAVPLYGVDAEEMAKILMAVFEELIEDAEVEEGTTTTTTRDEKTRKTSSKSKRTVGKPNAINSLNVIALPKVAQAVFLIGTAEEIKKAVAIIEEVEGQVGEARDKSIFWYNVRHSDPEELAQVMQKIYMMMIQNRIGYEKTDEEISKEKDLQREIERDRRMQEELQAHEKAMAISQPTYFSPPFYQQGDYVVNPRPIQAVGAEKKEYNVGRDNFIVDPKTGSLVMVIESDLIPKLKDVIKKLDVPKKMVQIEVMLFERIMRRQNAYGLNILKLGDIASNLNQSASAFHGDGSGSGVGNCLDSLFSPCVGRGIFEFFYSDKHVPIDFAYKFMMTQDNVFLNASPSVVTMNQTEATIAIKDERSILVGTTFPDATPGVVAQDSFTRAQYGITITVTPTIHMGDEEDPFGDPTNYVSLVSHINFDTFPPGQELSNQPLVNRREIINEVRIPDGQTVIIGGLRQKNTDDTVERIPFLGEIPGIGKLFSHTRLKDDDTELIIFLTPKIISDPAEDFARLRSEQLCLRPGDLPCFIWKLNEALDREKERVFQGFMSILFGRPKPRYICEEVEYDGR